MLTQSNSADSGSQHQDVHRVPPPSCYRVWSNQSRLRAWWRRPSQAIDSRQGPAARVRERARADSISAQVPGKRGCGYVTQGLETDKLLAVRRRARERDHPDSVPVTYHGFVGIIPRHERGHHQSSR